MEPLEIQVLSGVHSGARYRVESESFRLAGDDVADLVLLDAAAKGLEFSFCVMDGARLSILSRADYDILDDQGLSVRPKTQWALGQFLVIGDVVLGLARLGAPAMTSPKRGAGQMAQVFAEALKSVPARAVPLDATKVGAAPQDPEKLQARRTRRVAVVALMSVVLLVVAGGGVIALLAMEADQGLQAAVAASAAAPKKPVVTPAVTSESLAPTAEELTALRRKSAREALERVLLAASLNEDVAVKWVDDAVALEATVNPGAVPDLERVLLDFDRDHGSQVKLAVRVTPLWTLLPFRIREVVPGRNGWIVTDAGERVLLGGEVRGYTLTSLNAERVVLTAGAKRVEIDL